MKYIPILFLLLCYIADSRVYDRNWNRSGYKVKEGGRTVIYDKDWNKKGYEVDNKRYDEDWNRIKEYKVYKDSSR